MEELNSIHVRQHIAFHRGFRPITRPGSTGGYRRAPIDPHAPVPTSQLKIVYQNIQGWKTNANIHRRTLSVGSPDIILIADTGLEDRERLGFHPYIVYKRNTQKKSSGVAILIKKNIQHHRVDHQFLHDTVAIVVETTTGPIIVATNYHPPIRNYLPMEDLSWLACHSTPVYLLADLNAHHRSFPFCSGRGNSKGLVLHDWWMKSGKLLRLGPNFPTVATHNSAGTTPDIVLTNNKTYHNYFISPMPASVSDHLPVKMIISSKPIIKKVKCENIKGADWDSYKEHIKSNTEVLNLRNTTKDVVDEGLQKIIVDICDSRAANIPMVKVCTRPFITTSDKFKHLLKGT